MIEAQPLTAIQVVDSAIKIGLGAVIGGLIGFFTQRYVNNQLKEKSRKEEYRKRIFEIVDALGKTHATTIHFIAVGTAVPIDKDMARYQQAEIEFQNAWKGSMSLGFQLDVLGLSESAQYAHAFLLSLTRAGDAIIANINGDPSIDRSIHQNFDNLIASIKSDYQSMF
jgi:hypothetical protein